MEDEFIPERFIKGDPNILPMLYAGVFVVISLVAYFGR